MNTFVIINKVIAGFDRDEGNIQKTQKHGVTVEEIERLFGTRLIILPDMKHSHLEERFGAVGHNSSGRLMLVAFTLRLKEQKFYIRPISARFMSWKEGKKYEQALAEISNR